MRSVFAIAALLLALFLSAAPSGAVAFAIDEPVAATDPLLRGVDTAADTTTADTTATAPAGHCPHVPCPNTAHSHTPGGCTGHSFVPSIAFETSHAAVAVGRAAIKHENIRGRTLLPPVPPPLA